MMIRFPHQTVPRRDFLTSNSILSEQLATATEETVPEVEFQNASSTMSLRPGLCSDGRAMSIGKTARNAPYRDIHVPASDFSFEFPDTNSTVFHLTSIGFQTDGAGCG